MLIVAPLSLALWLFAFEAVGVVACPTPGRRAPKPERRSLSLFEKLAMATVGGFWLLIATFLLVVGR